MSDDTEGPGNGELAAIRNLTQYLRNGLANVELRQANQASLLLWPAELRGLIILLEEEERRTVIAQAHSTLPDDGDPAEAGP